jgi:hypothetical protein
MTTWSEVFAEIRIDLKDTGTVQRYTDDQLFLWSKDAVRDYSQYFPKITHRTELTLSGDSYPLPALFLREISIECPRDTFIEARMDRPGIKHKVVTVPSRYLIEGGSLFLNATPQEGAEVLLSYEGMHTLPTSYEDASTVTIPDTDLELVRLYVKAKSAEALRTQQATLDRFKLGSGDRDDNPLGPETYQLMQEYRRKISERTEGGFILLWRPGRKR